MKLINIRTLFALQKHYSDSSVLLRLRSARTYPDPDMPFLTCHSQRFHFLKLTLRCVRVNTYILLHALNTPSSCYCEGLYAAKPQQQRAQLTSRSRLPKRNQDSEKWLSLGLWPGNYKRNLEHHVPIGKTVLRKKDGNMSKDTGAIVKGFPMAKCGMIIKIKNENTH